MTETAPSQAERYQTDLRRAVKAILTAWPYAVRDAEASGMPARGDGMPASGGHSDLTSSVAVELIEPARPGASVDGFAFGWLAELYDTLRAVLQPCGYRSVPTSPSAALGPLLVALRRRSIGRTVAVRMFRLADDALSHWPPPPKKGQKVGAVTVGQRGNDVEMCGLCGDPAPSGRDINGRTLLHRMADGVVYHAHPCYYRVYFQRRRTA